MPSLSQHWIPILTTVRSRFSDNRKIVEAVDYLLNNPVTLDQLLDDLDRSIAIFNTYHTSGVIQYPKPSELVNVNNLHRALDDRGLPTTEQLINTLKERQFLLDSIVKDILTMSFPNYPVSADCLAGLFITAAYSTAVMYVKPTIQDHHASIVNSIGEVLSVMASNGNKTGLYQTIKK